MKYSNIIGTFASLATIAFCFAPWVYIPLIKTTITGFYTAGTSFGQPGIMHTVICVLAIACFLIPRVWAKRVNLFLCAFNLAWAVRNYILITQCFMGECPEKKMGMYAVVASSAVMMVMSLLPKMKTAR